MRISVTSSVSGSVEGKPGLAAYAASKGGLHALTAALAADHSQEGVRVHLVVPPPRTASGMVEAMGVALEDTHTAEAVATEVADLLDASPPPVT